MLLIKLPVFTSKSLTHWEFISGSQLPTYCLLCLPCASRWGVGLDGRPGGWDMFPDTKNQPPRICFLLLSTQEVLSEPMAMGRLVCVVQPQTQWFSEPRGPLWGEEIVQTLPSLNEVFHRLFRETFLFRFILFFPIFLFFHVILIIWGFMLVP